jgi:hypothetical protein
MNPIISSYINFTLNNRKIKGFLRSSRFSSALKKLGRKALNNTNQNEQDQINFQRFKNNMILEFQKLLITSDSKKFKKH